MIWLPLIVLGGIILLLLLSPALEVRLDRRVIRPVVGAAAVAMIALMLASSAGFAENSHTIQISSVLSGILSAVSLFIVVIACARFAEKTDASPAEGSAKES